MRKLVSLLLVLTLCSTVFAQNTQTSNTTTTPPPSKPSSKTQTKPTTPKSMDAKAQDIKASTPTPTPEPQTSGKTYKNKDGQIVPSPRLASSPPAGASAKCKDGTYSFSKHRQGTCSHHGGVATWL